jgi:hypothetical protein
MSFWSRQLGSSAIAIFITGSSAMADVTAAQVWSDFQSYLTGFGYTVTGEETSSGNTLTVTGLTMTFDSPADNVTATFGMDSLTFAETGDGRVRVTMPGSMPLTFQMDPPTVEGESEAQPVAGTLAYTQQGFEMVVSGDPDNMVYTYSAAEMAFTLTSLIVGAETIAIDEAVIRMTDVTGESTNSGTDLRTAAQTMAIAAMDYVLDMANPDDPTGRISFAGGLKTLAFDGAVTMPAGVDMTDTAVALRAGFAVDGSYSYVSGATDLSITGQGQTFESNSSSANGRLTVQMDGTRIAYSGAASDVALNYAGSDVPLPVSLGMGEAGFNMLVPIGQTPEPTDFALGLTMADLTVSDAIWGMVDPAGQLPRDPATLRIDLTGKARLTQDIMDEDQMMAAMGTPPGELHELTVNQLTLAIAGAMLTGEGAFTFDNTDLTTFDGMPRPAGSLDLRLTGGNALMDTLVAMGLLPQEQAMGARMMLGLFARPGDGPDSLTSQIEVTPDGQVLANGQRLR